MRIRDSVSSDSASSSSRIPDAGARRSLVVCADPERVAGLAEAGALRGWVVESYLNAAAALRRIAERPFDTLTVCGAEPEGALEVARALRASLPHAPLLLVIDGAGTTVRALAALSGVSEVVLAQRGPSAIVDIWDAHHAARAADPRVLVIAGDPSVRDTVEGAFRADGFAVRALSDGSRFFEESADWSPEAVVLDLAVQRPGAWDLLNALRASAEWRDVPVVLVGTHLEAADRVRAGAMAADAVVDLPAPIEALVGPVRTRIRRARLSGSGAPRGMAREPVTPSRSALRAPRAVVLVEGSPGMAELLRFACPPAPGGCTIFHDGAEALRYLQNGEAPARAVIVLDLDLAGINGADGVRRLVRAAGHDYRVIATTGSASEGEQVRALRAGAVDCLVKPLSLALFTAKLERLLEEEAP